MKDVLKIALIESFSDGFTGIFIALTSWFAMIVLLGSIVYGLLFLVDYTYRPINKGVGVVISKAFIPEHTQTIWIYNAALKRSLPQTNYYSDEWMLCIKVNDLHDNISVSKNHFHSIKEGQRLRIKYSFGRIYKTLYIKEILF